MKIGILNSGGDAQGLNTVIASIVIYGRKRGHSFIGFLKGWEGILDREFIDLDTTNVEGISNLGGTILHTINRGRFSGKKGADGQLNEIPKEIIHSTIDSLKSLEVDLIIAIGGDGSLSTAQQLALEGVKIIFVPKTIDNDLQSTDYTFGFSSAVDIIKEALDRLSTTTESHQRIMIVEVMGRNSGFLALHGGLAGGANMILIPEIEFTYQNVAEFVRWRKHMGKNFTVILVSEGAKASGESQIFRSYNYDGEFRLGGIGEVLASKILQLTGNEFEVRNVNLGHTQRGGSPNSFDRKIAKIYGVGAIDFVDREWFNSIVSLQNDKIVRINFENSLTTQKKIDEDNIYLQTAKKLGISFGD